MKKRNSNKYGLGGFLKDTAQTGFNAFKMAQDNMLSGLGMPDVIRDSSYKGPYADQFAKASSITNKVAPVIAGAVAGPLAGIGQSIGGQFNPTMQPEVNNNRVLPMQYQNENFKCGGKKRMPMGGMLPYGPNAEIENNEVVETPNGQMPGVMQGGQLNQTSGNTFTADGQSHAQGGIDTNLPGGTRVFSDVLKQGKHTYAELADKVSKSKGKYEKVLNDPKATNLAKNTAKLMLKRKEAELNNLFNEQESMKMGGTVGNKYKDGGQLPKYFNGGSFLTNPEIYNQMQGIAQSNMAGLGNISGPSSSSPFSMDNLSGTGLGRSVSNIDVNSKNIYDFAQLAPSLINVGRGLFDKTDTLNARDYYNPYESQIVDDLTRSKYDPMVELEQNMVNYRTGLRNLRNTSPTTGSYLANLGSLSAARARADQAARVNAYNINNQATMQRANALSSLGAQRGQTRLGIDQYNAQARAAKEAMLNQGLQGLSQYGQTQYTNNLWFNSLDDMYKNYGIDRTTGKYKVRKN